MTTTLMSKEKFLLDISDMVVALGTLFGSAAGLKLLKLVVKYTKEKRNQLRDEWREDLVTQNKEMKAEIETRSNAYKELAEKNTELKVVNARLKERVVQSEKEK